MSEWTPFIVIGIVTGSVYGICAMGLVLTYKTSGVFNISHGAVCAASAYAFFELRQERGLPWPVAAALVVLVFAPLAGLLLERLAVALSPVPTVYKIVGTVGLLVAIRSTISLIFTDQGKYFAPFLPRDTAFTVAQVGITVEQLIIAGIGVTSAVGLALFFKRTRLGLAMRGVVNDPQLLDMTGQAPARVRRSAWVIGSCFASVSGILFASTQAQLDVNVLTLLVVQAFGAATIGRFQSLPLAFVGGLVVGVAQKVGSKAVGTHEYFQGLDLAVPFIVLFIGLLVIPRHKLVEVGQVVKSVPAPAPLAIRTRTRLLAYAAGGAFILGIPHFGFVGTHLPAYNQALTQVILFVSLHLLVRTSGQISLCHFAFAAIGACGFAHMLGRGVPFGLAVLIGGLVCVVPALIIAVPAIRLSSLYLALATLGFGIFVAQYGYGKSFMFGFGALESGRPSGFDDDKKYYYLLLAFAVAAVALVLLLERSRMGRLLRGLSDSPTALVTLGLSVNVARVLVFCISGFLAGVSGALLASLFGSVNQDSFVYIQSLVALAVLAISGRRTITVAIVAPVLLYVVPNYISNPDANIALQISFGVIAIFTAINSQGAVQKLLATGAVKNAKRKAGPAGVRIALGERPRELSNA